MHVARCKPTTACQVMILCDSCGSLATCCQAPSHHAPAIAPFFWWPFNAQNVGRSVDISHFLATERGVTFQHPRCSTTFQHLIVLALVSSPVELGHEDPSVDSTVLVVHNSLPLAPMLMQSLDVHVSLTNSRRQDMNVNVERFFMSTC